MIHTDHSTENVNITGCAIALFKGSNKIMLCEENRVVLSYAEQKSIGDVQPYMLPKPTLDHEGKPVDLISLGGLINERMNKKKHPIPNISDAQKLQLVTNAQSNHQRFALTGRYFQHAVLRERSKQGETPQDACKRLLREEYYRTFKGGVVPQYDFVYQRKGSKNAIFVYLIQVDTTEIDSTIVNIKGKSNYFCAKEIPSICRNDYNETRNHQFLSIKDAKDVLERFSNKYPKDTYDTSRWGGLDLFNSVLNHINERKMEQLSKKQHSTVKPLTISCLPAHILALICFYVGTTKIRERLHTGNNHQTKPETLAKLLFTKKVSPNLLIVGSGNFTFPAAITKLRSETKNLYGTFNQTNNDTCFYATSYDSSNQLYDKYGRDETTNILNAISSTDEATVRHNIDATKLHSSNYFNSQKFDLIVFNFPKVGTTSLEEFQIAGRVPRNRHLIASFLVSAKHILKPNGAVVIAQKIGQPYRCWSCTSATKWAEQVQQRMKRNNVFNNTSLNSNSSSSSEASTNSVAPSFAATLAYHSCSAFQPSIFPSYRSANVSPAGSGRRKKGFRTVAADGKPTAYMHVFTMKRNNNTSTTFNNNETLNGCILCNVVYQSIDEGRQHEKGKKHKSMMINEKEWNKYLNYLYPN